MFNQALFLEVGTRFSSENEGNQNSLLWPEKTFSFNQALFLEVETRSSSENEGNQISLLGLEKTFSFNQALLLEVGTRLSSKNEGNQISLLSHPKGQYYSPQELLKYLLLKLIICGNIQSLSMIILRVY